MRSVDSWLDRFCYKHPRLGIPNLMTILVVGTALVYLMDLFSGGMFSAMLDFYPAAILRGQVWRLVTFLFIPLSYRPITLILSLYFYWWIGKSLEREWGTTKFTVFYACGVLFNIIFGFLAGSTSVTYLNLSLFFAFASLYPDLQVLLIFIPVKVKWLAWIDAAFFALTILFNLINFNFVGALLPLVAILNYVLFFWSFLRDFVRRIFRRYQHQSSRQTINFKKAAREAKKDKGYLHKCAVCGVTDADDPNMEFRYCSKCNGYYCYCADHINNHVHIQ